MCKLANPDYVIHLKNLSEPSAILRFCKKNNIKDIAYQFIFNNPIEHKDICIKIGRSAGGEIGERIYRQAGHLEGWPSALSGPSGSDLLEVVVQYEKANPRDLGLLSKDNFTIKIWDVTGVLNENINDDAYPTRLCENELMNEYEAIHGCLPIGNPKDTRNEMMKPYTSRTVWNNMFDE